MLNRCLALIAFLCLQSGLVTEATIVPVTPDLPPAQQILPQKDNELTHLDNLIESTQRTLQMAQGLRDEVKEYLSLQDRFAADTNNRDLGFRMVKSARHLLAQIEESHLEQAFPPSFVRELATLSEMAGKKNPTSL